MLNSTDLKGPDDAEPVRDADVAHVTLVASQLASEGFPALFPATTSDAGPTMGATSDISIVGAAAHSDPPQATHSESPPPPTVGLHVIRLPASFGPEEAQQRSKEMLFRALNSGRLVVFVGSGPSLKYDYPTWRQLLQELLGELQLRLGSPASNRHVAPGTLGLASLQIELRAAFEKLRDMDPRQYPSLSSVANELLLKKGFGARDRGRDSEPLQLLVERLGIKRFVTTNYEHVVENCLEKHASRWGSSSPGSANLTILRSDLGKLWQFAVGAPFSKPAVFHCHGVARESNGGLDEHVLILTEEDYRSVYLGDSWEAASYRRIMSTIFEANPILFVGYGMQEEDVLRHLRQYMATESFLKRDRPVFCLLPRWRDPESSENDRRQLLHKYNIKTIYFPSDRKLNLKLDDRGLPDWAAAPNIATVDSELCNCLRELAIGWSDWLAAYQRKPQMRIEQFTRRESGAVIRHWIDPLKGKFKRFGDTPFACDDKQPVVEAAATPGVHLVLGKRGTSKGTIGAWLVSDADDPRLPQKQRRVFATAHFTNDVTTLIAGIVDAIRPSPTSIGAKRGRFSPSMISELRDLLINEQALVVIGGFERMLRERTDRVAWNRKSHEFLSEMADFPVRSAASLEVRWLIDMLAEVAVMGMKSSVVITSSAIPLELTFQLVENPRKASHVHRLTGKLNDKVSTAVLQGLSNDECAKWWMEEGQPGEDAYQMVQQLAHGLRQHAYAASVVAKALEHTETKEKKLSLLSTLRREAMAIGADRRVERIVRVCELEMTKDSHDATAILKAVCQCTVPVAWDEIALMCPASENQQELQDRKKRLDELVERRLLLVISGHPERFTAHSTMRAAVLHSLGAQPIVSGEPHGMGLECFAMRLGEVQGGPREAYKTSGDLVRTFTDKAMAPASSAVGKDARVRQLRTAFAMLRSRWSATGLGQWSAWTKSGGSRADTYQYRLVEVLNATRRLSNSWYKFELPTADCFGKEPPFYGDELSWLYNEIGLVWFMQGFLEDALVAFRMAYDVNVACERGKGGPRWCQSKINLGLVQIEKGRLDTAAKHLEDVARVIRPGRDAEMYARCIGFTGLIEHLRGDLATAEPHYREAIQLARAKGNGRAVSVFSRHLSDLTRRKQGDLDAADVLIKESLAAAEAGQDLDLWAYARVSRENLLLSREDGYECRLDDVRTMAQELGLPKLEAEACFVEGVSALSGGDVEHAFDLAVHCIGVCSGMGMRLRLNAALVLLGRVLKVRGDLEAARAVLQAAIDAGRRYGYQTKTEEATRLLLNLRP